MKIHYDCCNKNRVYLRVEPEIFQEILIKHVCYSVCMTLPKVYAGDGELGKELLENIRLKLHDTLYSILTGTVCSKLVTNGP